MSKALRFIAIFMIFTLLFSVLVFANKDEDDHKKAKNKIKKAKKHLDALKTAKEDDSHHKKDKKKKGKKTKEKIGKAKGHTPSFTVAAVGDFCSGIGTFKASKLKCSLNTDVSSTITISDDDVTLDCKKHLVLGTGLGIGIVVTGDRVTVKNCEVSGWEIGIITDSDDNIISKNTLDSNSISSIVIDDPSTATIPHDNMVIKNEITGTATTAGSPNSDVFIIGGTGHVVTQNDISGPSDNLIFLITSTGSIVSKNDLFFAPSRQTIIGGAAVNSILGTGTIDSNDFAFGATGNVQGVSFTNSGGSVVTKNKFDLGPAGCVLSGASCPGGTAVMVRLFNGQYTIDKNTFTGSGKSQQVLLATNIGGSLIQNNDAKNMRATGIEIQDAGVSGNTQIINNKLTELGETTLSGTLAAIRIAPSGTSFNLIIADNTITDSFGDGIQINPTVSITSSTIGGNTIKGSANDGLVIKNQGTFSGNLITRNIIRDNGGDGLDLTQASGNDYTLNDIFSNTGFQANSDVSVELSDGVRGNYWGLNCPILFREPPLSNPTSNMAGVVDSFPFDSPVAGFIGLPTPTVC